LGSRSALEGFGLKGVGLQVLQRLPLTLSVLCTFFQHSAWEIIALIAVLQLPFHDTTNVDPAIPAPAQRAFVATPPPENPPRRNFLTAKRSSLYFGTDSSGDNP